jgi:conjugation trbI family protein
MKKEEYDETEEMSEEIVEENKFQEILKNKKIMIPVIVGVALLMIFFLFSKPKEEKTKEVKSSDKIDTSELYTNNNDPNNPLYQNQYQGEQSNLNPAQNQEFPEVTTAETGNLQEPPAYYNPNSTSSSGTNTGHQYQSYNAPSSYNLDEPVSTSGNSTGLGFNENISGETGNESSKNVSNDRKRTGLKVERNKNKSMGNNVAGSEQNTGQNEENQQQVQPTGRSQKNSPTQNRFALNQRLIRPKSNFILQTGARIPAILSDNVDSDLPGNIRAVVTQDVYDSIRNRYLLIPKGSKLYGMYNDNIIYGQNRMVLIWQRVILPNGMSIDLEAMQGADITGQTGIRGKVNNHTWKLLRSIVMSSFVNFFSSGLSVSAQKKTGKNTSVRATVGQNVADETSNNIKNAGDSILERDLKQQPTVKLRAGTRFYVMVNADMELYPYNKLTNRR